MTKTQMEIILSEKLEISKSESKIFVNTFLKVLQEGLKKDQVVKFTGTGTFKVVVREPREYRNPRTGKIIKKGKTKVVKFTPGTILKNQRYI